MKKVGFVFAIVVLLAGASVHAQKTSDTNPAPTRFIRENIVIEDESTGNFLLIAPTSGEYKFHRCSDGFTMGGIGIAKFDGCAVSFEDNQADHRVLASINLCAQEAKAIVERFAPVLNSGADPVKVLLYDTSLADNTMSCLPKK